MAGDYVLKYFSWNLINNKYYMERPIGKLLKWRCALPKGLTYIFLNPKSTQHSKEPVDERITEKIIQEVNTERFQFGVWGNRGDFKQKRSKLGDSSIESDNEIVWYQGSWKLVRGWGVGCWKGSCATEFEASDSVLDGWDSSLDWDREAFESSEGENSLESEGSKARSSGLNGCRKLV